MVYQLVKSLPYSPGIKMDIKLDPEEPENYVAEVHAQGKNDQEPFFVPTHWHKNHTEHITVLKGRMEALVDGKKIILRAGDDPLLIPPRVVHGFKGFKGEELVMREMPLPGGRYKAEFFNDMLQLGGVNQLNRASNVLLIFRCFYENDTYPELPFYFRFIDQVFVAVIGRIALPFALGKPDL